MLASQTFDAGPFSVEMVKMAHSIPTRSRSWRSRASSARRSSRATTSSTRRRLTACRRTYRGSLSWPRGAAAPLRRLDQRRPRGGLAVGVRRGTAAGRGLRSLPGPHRRHLLRLQHPPSPTGGGRGRSARAQSFASRPLHAQEREHRAHAGPYRCARGHAGGRQGDRKTGPQACRDLHREPGGAAVGPAPDGARRPSSGGSPRRRHRRLLGHLDPRQRAGGQRRNDRPHLPPGRDGVHARRRAGARFRPRLAPRS